MPERLILERAYVGLSLMVQNESNIRDPEATARIEEYRREQQWILEKIEELDK